MTVIIMTTEIKMKVTIVWLYCAVEIDLFCLFFFNSASNKLENNEARLQQA